MATIDPSLLDPQNLATLLNVDVDETRAGLLLTLACNLAATVLDPLPAEALGVVLSVAARGYVNPEGNTSETTGNYSYTTVAGIYLMRGERQALKSLAGRGGAFTVDPTPSDAGSRLPTWDRNVFWPSGEPSVDEVL